MALEEKTKLNNMLSGQQGGAIAPTPGKQTRSDGDGGLGLDGGEGEKATKPSPAANSKSGPADKVTATTTPAAKNPSTSRTSVGVGEKVTFNAAEDGAWTIDQKDVGSGRTLEWVAPDHATMANVVHTPFLDSPNKDKPGSLPMFVVAPHSVDFKKTGDVPVGGPNLAGVGMTTAVTVGPENVSFSEVEWLEQPGPATGVEGYFAALKAVPALGQDLAHNPNPKGLAMGANNNDVRDNAWTMDKPKLPHPVDKTQRWWAGAFEWSIPNLYRVKGGAWQTFAHVTQRFVMDDVGAITVTKGAASATAHPNNVLDGDIQKYPTMNDARGLLHLHGRGGCVQAVMNYVRNPKADPTSVTNLIAALTAEDVDLYTYVTCKNTYAWTDPDEVVMTATANRPQRGAATKINTGKGAPIMFKVNQIFNLQSMSTSDVINFTALIDGTHPQTATLAYPYSMKEVQMSGSDRYTISAYFQ